MDNNQTVEAAPTGKNLTGIGGWLSLRIFAYIFLVPAQAVYYLLQAEVPLSHFLEATLGILCFVAGVQLFRLKPVGVKLAKVAEGATIVIGILILLVDPTAGIRTIVGGTIWLMYFYKSVRVQNTYFAQRAHLSSYANASLAGQVE
jgi:hypothetical protein